MKFVCTLITVTDMHRSRTFYESVLGQRVKHDFGENVQFEGGFAIHLRSHFSTLIGDVPVDPPGNGSELYFESDDIDTIIPRLETEEVTFVHPLREQPWRQKVVRFHDPDGYMVEVGESLSALVRRLAGEGLTVEMIRDATGMTAEFISGILNSDHHTR